MLPKTMRAAVCENYHQPLVIKEVPIRDLAANDCLVKIHASGVCHTDFHAINGDWAVKPKLPLIPGHEGVGEVVAVGTDVKRLKIGDRVGIPWNFSTCGECRNCLTGHETICSQSQNAGYSVDGGYAEYCVADARYVGMIPDSLSYEQAAPVMCAGVTTYKALKNSQVKPQEWVAIFGIGGLGHLGIQYAKAMGMKVAAIDIDDAKLRLAQEMGVDLTINSLNESPKEILQTKLGGVDGAIVTAVTKGPFHEAFYSLRSGGTLVCVGLPPEDMSLPIVDLVLREIKITGSLVGTRQDLQEALTIAGRGLIHSEVTTAKLTEVNEIFEKMRTGKIVGRTVLTMD